MSEFIQFSLVVAIAIKLLGLGLVGLIVGGAVLVIAVVLFAVWALRG